MGGGRRAFIPVTVPDPVTHTIDGRQQRLDGQDLIEVLSC